MTFAIKGLDHVVLRVADLDRAIRFYCEVLGCREERRVESINLVQLRAGASRSRASVHLSRDRQSLARLVAARSSHDLALCAWASWTDSRRTASAAA